MQWPRVKEIVGAALERPASERDAFLAEACSRDAELRREVESLLAAYDAAEVLSVQPWAKEVVEPELPLAAIGPYRLERELGVGGMGQVWLAEQMEPLRRWVALKLIKAGLYDASIMQRFQAERQSLALMDHPVVAKVLDAGATPAGQPYFVMEYVDGLPITEYCDRHTLNIRERLDLFMQVCDGVQHAHQKAIIHRDLKPSNILVAEVDGKPLPRIIDFGLAKAMRPGPEQERFQTRLGAFLGTPGYMSPEQADPQVYDIDTRTDVYSLGVVLYELLTGFLPFDANRMEQQHMDEVLRDLRESTPRRPSARVSVSQEDAAQAAEARATTPRQLAGLLRGDLDWIALKAMEKDRERRYGTPSELAADIERCLENRPVLARPPSTAYRLRKYIRRNRVGAGAAGAVFLLLAAFAAAQAIQLRRITRERDRADRITQFMTGLFMISDPSESRGNTVTAREILDKSSKDIDSSLASDPELRAQMMEVMGEVYESLGLSSRAEVLLREAVEMRRSLLGPHHLDTLRSMDNLAWALYEEGKFAASEKMQREVLEQRRKILGTRDQDTLASMSNLAAAIYAQGRYPEAEKLERETLAIQRDLMGPADEDTLTSMNNLANTLSLEDRIGEAEALRRETLEAQRRALGPEFPDTLRSITNLADTLDLEGRHAEAEKLERQALEAQRRVDGPEHPDTLITLNNLADTLNREGRFAEAERDGRTALEIRRRVLGEEHEKTLLSMVTVATSLMHKGHFKEAEALLGKALETQRRVLRAGHRDTAASMYAMAVLKERTGRRGEALALLQEAVQHGLTQHQMREMGSDPDLAELLRDANYAAIDSAARLRVQAGVQAAEITNR